MTLAFPKPSRPKKAPRRLTRKTWMRKRRPRRLSRPGSDPAYLGFVRSLPCLISNVMCWGRTHAHHAIHRSQGGKDDSAVPLCSQHHAQWHEAAGVFSGWTKFERFAWATRAIAETQAAYRWQR